MRHHPPSHVRPRAGQAIVEFTVGLVCILILIAALVQLGALARRDTRNLHTARARAGADALADVHIAPVSPGARYIRDWSSGPDGSPYTRDDVPLSGNAALFSDGVVAHAHPDTLETFRPGNPLSPLADPALVMPGFRFVRGHAASAAVPLLPISRTLFFGRDSITLESDVFLIWTRGLE